VAADNNESLPAIEETLRESPADAHLLEQAERVARQEGAWGVLADIWVRALDTADRARRAELSLKLARLYRDDIGFTAEAVRWYAEVLVLDPSSKEASDQLEAMYEELERPADLVQVLHRMVPLCETVGEKVSLLERIARISTEELNDPESAIKAYGDILEHDPAYGPALSSLEGLHADREEWEQVLGVLDMRIAISTDEEDLAEYCLVKGDILRHRMNSMDEALDQYLTAMQIIPGHLEGIERAISLLDDTEQWDRLVRFLLGLAKATDNEELQARFFARMGQCIKDHKDDPDDAIQLFEAALERVPNLPAALAPLSELYMEQELWAKALPLLHLRLRLAADEGASRESAGLFRQLGEACRRTGDKEEALEYYRRAFDKDPDSPETLEALGELNLEQGNREVAASYFRQFLELAGKELFLKKVGPIYSKLGQLELSMGRPEAAREYLDLVLTHLPGDIDTLRSLVKLLQSQSAWAEANEHRRRLLKLLDQPLERWNLLIAIGDTCLDKLDDRDGAMAAYEDALAAEPGSKGALVKLLEMHVADREFAGAVEILRRLVDLETDSSRKADFSFTIATLLREELHELDDSTVAYEQALEADPDRLDVLKVLVELLTEDERWEALEGVYLRMLERLAGRERKEVEQVLYKGLGELYVLHLSQPGDAIAAYQAAAGLKPDDAVVHEALAHLYEQAERNEDALAEHRTLVCLEPRRLDSYRKMASHLRTLGREDDAWFCLGVLGESGPLADAEKSWVDSRRPVEPVSTSRSLTPGLWSEAVFSRAEDTRLGELFHILHSALGRDLESGTLKQAGLKKRDLFDLTGQALFAAVFNRVAGLLDVPAPAVYLREGQQGMALEPTNPPVVVIGEQLLTGRSEKELAFLVAKNLTYCHPKHVPAACCSGDLLKLLYLVAVAHAHPDPAGDDEDDRQFQSLVKSLGKRLSDDDEETLVDLVGQIHGRQRKPGVSRWLTGVELTANHAGLLASMEFSPAVAALRADAVSRCRLPKEDQVAELAMYAVSEEFARVRDALGLSLEQPQ